MDKGQLIPLAFFSFRALGMILGQDFLSPVPLFDLANTSSLSSTRRIPIPDCSIPWVRFPTQGNVIIYSQFADVALAKEIPAN